MNHNLAQILAYVMLEQSMEFLHIDSKVYKEPNIRTLTWLQRAAPRHCRSHRLEKATYYNSYYKCQKGINWPRET